MTLKAQLEEAQGRVVDLEALERRVVENESRRSLAEKVAAGAVALSCVLVIVVLFLSSALVARNKAVEALTDAGNRARAIERCQDAAFAEAYDEAVNGKYVVGDLLVKYEACENKFPG